MDSITTSWVADNTAFNEPFDYHRMPHDAKDQSAQSADFKLDKRIGLSVRRQMRDREAEYSGYLKSISETGYKLDWSLPTIYHSAGLSHKQRHYFIDKLVHGHMNYLTQMFTKRYTEQKDRFNKVCSSKTFKWKWGQLLKVVHLTKPGHWVSEGGALVFEINQPYFGDEESAYDAGDWHDFLTVFGDKRPLCERCTGAGKLSCEEVNCHFTMQHPNHKCPQCGGHGTLRSF